MKIGKYILKRTIISILSLFIIISALYFFGQVMNIQLWSSPHPISEDIKFVSSEYVTYVKGIVTSWDFGSDQMGNAVWDIVIHKAPITLIINFGTLLVFTIVGIGLGMICANFQNKWIDRVLTYTLITIGTIPIVVTSGIAILVLGYHLHLLPARFSLASDSIYPAFSFYIIPIMILSIYPISIILRIIRAELIESKEETYFQLAKAKGFSDWSILLRHSLRNSLVPVLPEIQRLFIFTLGTSFYIEVAYGANGVANLFYNTIVSASDFGNYVTYDMPKFLMIMIFYFSLIILIGFIIDILHVIIDPRIMIIKK